jgi:hypothetical protein
MVDVPAGTSATFATGTNDVATSAHLRALGRDALLRDYRDWLESELKLLGNASHHAYSFGQANMAKRAIEKLDELLGKQIYVPLDVAAARRALTAIEMLEQQSTAELPEIDALRDAVRATLEESGKVFDAESPF